MTTSAERIREMRLRQKLTLDDVAKYLDVNRQAIYKYEHGVVTNIPLDNLEKMAKLFGTTPGYLAGWSDDEPPEPVSHKPTTPEGIRILSGLEKMPPEQRARAEQLLQVAFAEYFKEDNT